MWGRRPSWSTSKGEERPTEDQDDKDGAEDDCNDDEEDDDDEEEDDDEEGGSDSPGAMNAANPLTLRLKIELSYNPAFAIAMNFAQATG